MRSILAMPGNARKLLPMLADSAAYLDDSIGQPIEVAETVPRRFVRQALMIAAISVLCAVAAAGVFRVNEVSRGRGTLVPDGFEQPVQHFEGGVVEAVMAREGDTVRKGQTILRLRDASTLEDVEVLERQRADLTAQMAVQMALSEARAPDFSAVPARYAREVSTNQAAYLAQALAVEAQRRQYRAQIDRAEADLAAVGADLQGAGHEADYARSEDLRFGALYAKGLVSQVQSEDRRRQRLAAEAAVASLDMRRQAADKRLAEAREALSSYLAGARAQASSRLHDLSATLTEVEGNLSKRQNREERLRVTSPIDGVIKTLNVRAPGAVVDAGATVAVVVPSDTPLIAEARVPASQIGHISVGQPVRISVTAYDFTRYGWLTGKVTTISPSSFQTADQQFFYVLRIAIEPAPGDRIRPSQLVAGMELNADIVTGDKTVLQYLLKPLQQAAQTSFQER